MIGVGLVAVRPGDGTGLSRGVRVASLVNEGPAQRAGLRAGDVVLEANGVPVLQPAELIEAVERAGVGGSLSLRLQRQGQVLTVLVRPVAMPGR